MSVEGAKRIRMLTELLRITQLQRERAIARAVLPYANSVIPRPSVRRDIRAWCLDWENAIRNEMARAQGD